MNVGSAMNLPPLLQGAGSLEFQIGLSVVILFVAIILLKWVVPTVVRSGIRLVLSVLARFGLGGTLDALTTKQTGWGLGSAIVGLLRLSTIGLAIVFLFGVWGYMDLINSALVELSIPLTAIVKAFMTVLLLVGAYSGMGLLHRWVTEVTAQSDQISPHQEEIWLRVLQIVFLIAAAIVALSLWGIDLGGLLVGAGFIGIVAGLAAQQTLGALIAGFVLMLSRPFEIGDWVKIGDDEGIITEITIVNTRMENFDGEVIALPNDVVGNSTIVNRSAKGRLRLRAEVGIDYDSDPAVAQTIAAEALKEVERILTVPKPRVVLDRFGDSAIVLELRFWIDKPSARRRALATSSAVKAVHDAFDEEGIKIPFPQRELTGREETGGFRMAEQTADEE